MSADTDLMARLLRLADCDAREAAATIEHLTRERDRYASDAGERAAKLDAAEAEIATVRRLLAGGDIGSLPHDWSISDIAEARVNDMFDLRCQVRDTCRRAEAAEAELAKAREALAFVAKMAWRTGPPNVVNNLTDVERLSAIKWHPTIREMSKPHRELAEREAALAPAKTEGK